MTEHLLLIDGMNLFIRAYCASPLMTADGQRVGGYLTSLKSIGKMLDEFRPSRAIIVWDGEGGSQRRRAIFSEYKAGRKIRLNRGDLGEDLQGDAQEDRENMSWQLQLLTESLRLLGVPQTRPEACEADDAIAFLAAEAWEGLTTIVTTDKDMLQLLDENRVRVYSPIKKVLFDRKKFIETYGILPENYRIMKALCGDGSDNIKGIKGFGEKTVVKHFPVLAEMKIGPSDIMGRALKMVEEEITLKKKVPAVIKALLCDEARFRENLELMDLSCPMIGAQAALGTRAALDAQMACRDFEFRMWLNKSGVTSSDERLTQPYKDHARRRAFAGKGNV